MRKALALSNEAKVQAVADRAAAFAAGAAAVLDALEASGAQVRVFGSRATGRAQLFPDLDLLAIEPARLRWEQCADLRNL